MNHLDRLFELLASHPALEIGRINKAVIERHPEWIADYQRMIALQKQLVRQTVDRSAAADQTKREIDEILERLSQIPSVDEYLNALNELQEDFAAVQDIFNQELSRQ